MKLQSLLIGAFTLFLASCAQDSPSQLPEHANLEAVCLFVSMALRGEIRVLSQLCERMLCMSTTARPMKPDV